jgi:hypothetical protein
VASSSCGLSPLLSSCYHSPSFPSLPLQRRKLILFAKLIPFIPDFHVIFSASFRPFPNTTNTKTWSPPLKVTT